MAVSKIEKPKQLGDVLADFKSAAVTIFIISGVVNVLSLTGALYMLQIYDRTLTSQSIPTLVAISVMAIGLYFFQGILDVTRSQVLVRLGARLDQRLAPIAHQVTVDMPRFGFSSAEATERGRDVDTLRHFLSGQGPIALFDLPWMPIYVIFVYLLHPMLGLVTLGGAVVLSLLTLLTEFQTRNFGAEAQQAAIDRLNIAESNARNADVIKAMGFADRVIDRFQEANSKHLKLQMKSSDVSGTLGAISKVLRMILQSAILGLGAYLTINGQLTAGAIIAASVASARALAPVDLLIGQWKNIVTSRRSYRRIKETLNVFPECDAIVDLPAPAEHLKIENLTVAAPHSGQVVLTDIAFDLKAGSALGLIGPSGGGKTTLAKAITGIWEPARGHVRLDGADIRQWPERVLGNHVGYLPQEIQLFDGTIADNICRFERDPESRKIINAARAAGVHEMIVRLADGYQTILGPSGSALSAGQRQRVALARALYDDPFLVVLDEPNSNLDAEGEAALSQAISTVRERKGIVIVIAHRPAALNSVDLVGVIQNGRLTAFDEKGELIQTLTQSVPGAPPARQAQPLPAAKPLARAGSMA